MNDYSLFDDSEVANAYARATASPYYLSAIGDSAPDRWVEATRAVDGPVTAIARTFDPSARFSLKRGSRVVAGDPASVLVGEGSGRISATITRSGKTVISRLLKSP